ncbi:MAG TPA: hypothetical protein VK864_11600 [Longimicrobiales bacterium]|nr:hypothetical protein [Longimicrobiales bacterium]
MIKRRTVTALVMIMSLGFAACDDDPAGPGGGNEPGAARITADITTNRTLDADTVYTLSGFIHVANGATLTIEAGTKIVGDTAVVGSSLFIMRGARIIAKGTADRPIVFTSARAEGQRAPGDWGGLIIVGNGVINRSGTVNIEGTGTGASNPLIAYSGGTNNADNSGELEYVRIEFAGYATAADQELNSLTLAAVGSGTRIQYVQSLAGLDDAFEFFGGAVDAKYLVSYESGDDHFDMSEGYKGRLQYLIGLQTRILTPRPGTGSVSSDPQGIENDGCAGAGCDNGQNSTPLTTPVVANFTMVGRGDASTITSGGDIGMVLRRGTGGFYVNGVLARWARAAISVRDASTQTRITDGDMTLNNILISEAPAIYQAGQQVGVDAGANDLILSASTAASLFTSMPAAPASVTQLDWMPPANAAPRNGGLATFTGKLQAAAAGAIPATAFRGAVDPNGPKWWQGWTAYAAN